MQMLPRLSAEESLSTATRVAMGTGSLNPDESQSILFAWRSTADHQQSHRSVRSATAEELAASGINVVKSPKARRRKAP